MTSSPVKSRRERFGKSSDASDQAGSERARENESLSGIEREKKTGDLDSYKGVNLRAKSRKTHQY